jgi:SAM-dependent methyltransferase
MSADPFETHACDYDAWYDRHPNTFQSEILAVQALLPPAGRWIEIGVGTGRFAARLGILRGVEPAQAMADLARHRGVNVLRGAAEALPLESRSVDAVFFLTALCFVDSLSLSLSEAHRVLVPGGRCLIAHLPLDGPLGRLILAHAESDTFFRRAHLRTTREMCSALAAAGFMLEEAVQTLVGPPEEYEREVQPPVPGHDRGSFVVLRAVARPPYPGAAAHRPGSERAPAALTSIRRDL